MLELTIQFQDRELENAIKIHLTSGIKVQNYIKAAMHYFELMMEKEKEGAIVGYGSMNNKDHFRRYNTEASPLETLSRFKEREE